MTKANKKRVTGQAGDRPTAVDLFSGCGGLTLGLKKAKFNVLGAVDNNTLANRTYRANHEDVAVWETDIRKLKPDEIWSKLELQKNPLDLLAGCPPCQGFSTLRTLNRAFAVDDPRNDLLLDFFRFVDALRPRAVMMENVPGLARDKRFTDFCKQMKELGYCGEHRILNVAKYGVPQRRRRLIYLAGLQMEIPFAKGVRKEKTVKDVIGKLPKAGESGDQIHDLPENRTSRIRKLIHRIPKDGGSRADLPEENQLACHKRCDGFKDVYGRMAWGKVSPTITSGCFNPSKGRFLHPEEDRAITMREAALLQGFPHDYEFPIAQGKVAVAAVIGNALPPPFVAAHASMIRKALRNAGVT